MKHYGSIQSYFHRVVDTTTIGVNTGANTTMGEENTTPVSKNPTAIPFSLESDRVKDEIRNRILEVREKCGCTNSEQFSIFLFGDKSSSKTIDSWTLGEKVTTPSLPSLVTISLKAGVSLDWLVFGKEETPAQEVVEEEKVINPKEIVTNLMAFVTGSGIKEIEEKKNALTESLLDNDRPVLQACASFLNLLRYANIILEDDYDIDNTKTPQSLTIKITPKLFDTKGYFDGNYFNCSFRGNHDSRLLFWDYRTTIIQRFIALSLISQKRSLFDEKTLLDSAIQFMSKNVGSAHYYYDEFDFLGRNRVHGLSHYSINDVFMKYTVTGQAYPLFFSVCNDDDLIQFTNYCNAEKVPIEIKIYGGL